MDDTKRFTLRMDSKLFDVIKEQSEKNKRSIAKEIEFILEKSLLNDSDSSKDPS